MTEELTSRKRKLRLWVKSISDRVLKSERSRRQFRVLVQNVVEMKYIRNGIYSRSLPRLFDYRSIAKKKYMYHDELYYDNTFFGCERVVRRFVGATKPIKACFEHGIFWGIAGNEKEYNSDLPGIITFGPKRVKRLGEVSTKKSFAIGPYIHYAPLYREMDLDQLKLELGKTLLVFPSHSIQFVKQTYDSDLLIQEINRLISLFDFQTVVVSFHPLDIEQKKHEPILQNGWRVFTAGNRYDPLFLSRLKSALWLCDAVLTNSAGTHIGYAISMNKPVRYYKQTIYREEVVAGDLKRSSTSGNKRASEDIAMLEDLFSIDELSITEEQLVFCNDYFGLNSIKSREELKAIVDFLEVEYQSKKS